MSTVSDQKSEYVPAFRDHVPRRDLETLREVSQDAHAWVRDALDFFAGHQNYDDCKDELEVFLLNTFSAETQQVETSIVSPVCCEIVRDYRVNDFLLGISAKLIVQHGKEKGTKLAKAFQRIWQAGTSSMLI